jgi:hypothetical protein
VFEGGGSGTCVWQAAGVLHCPFRAEQQGRAQLMHPFAGSLPRTLHLTLLPCGRHRAASAALGVPAAAHQGALLRCACAVQANAEHFGPELPFVEGGSGRVLYPASSKASSELQVRGGRGVAELQVCAGRAAAARRVCACSSGRGSGLCRASSRTRCAQQGRSRRKARRRVCAVRLGLAQRPARLIPPRGFVALVPYPARRSSPSRPPQTRLAERGFEVLRLNTYDTVPVAALGEEALAAARAAAVVTVGSPSAIRWAGMRHARAATCGHEAEGPATKPQTGAGAC